MLIAISSLYDFIIHQIDVKIVFLNGDLEDEIYMDQLEGFVIEGLDDKVCRVKKIHLWP